MRRLRLAALVVGCAGVGGCLSSDRVMSTGTVTFDGRPVETGSIVFRPLDARNAPEGAVIAAGRFTIEGRPGKHLVEIRGTRPVRPEKVPRTMPRFEGLPVHEDFIPPAYNAASALKVEVASGGRNVFDFDLKSPSAQP